MKRPSLESGANVAVILACLAVVAQAGVGIYRKPASITRDRQAMARPSVYPAGTRIIDGGTLNFSAAPKTLLLITASTCHFCSASMPFYKRLTADAKAKATRVVAVTAEDVSRNRSYLEANGVLFDQVVSATAGGITVSGTPTLVLVGRDGTVLNSWMGQLSSGQEHEVMAGVN